LSPTFDGGSGGAVVDSFKLGSDGDCGSAAAGTFTFGNISGGGGSKGATCMAAAVTFNPSVDAGCSCVAAGA
jgi:hypothetical protein